MAIYILKAYPTPHKCETDACIIGYFTTKAALFEAIRRYAFLWKVFDKDAFLRAIERGDVYALNYCSETGCVEKLRTNTYFVDCEEMTDFIDEDYFRED